MNASQGGQVESSEDKLLNSNTENVKTLEPQGRGELTPETSPDTEKKAEQLLQEKKEGESGQMRTIDFIIQEISRKITFSIEEQSKKILAQVLAQLKDVQNADAVLLDAIGKKIDKNETQMVLMDKMHSEMQKYKDGLLEDSKIPLFLALIKIYDALDNLERNASPNVKLENAKSAAPAFDKLLDNVSEIKRHLVSLLEEQNIEQINPERSSEFNRKEQRVVKIVPTDDALSNNKINDVSQIGFKNTVSQKLLRPAVVSVYQISQKESK